MELGDLKAKKERAVRQVCLPHTTTPGDTVHGSMHTRSYPILLSSLHVCTVCVCVCVCVLCSSYLQTTKLVKELRAKEGITGKTTVEVRILTCAAYPTHLCARVTYYSVCITITMWLNMHSWWCPVIYCWINSSANALVVVVTTQITCNDYYSHEVSGVMCSQLLNILYT